MNLGNESVDQDALAQIRDQFYQMRNGAQIGIDRFREELDSDPIRAIRWADSAIADAARLDLASSYLRWIDNSGNEFVKAPTADNVAEDLRSALIRGSRSTERSTSPTANTFNREVLSAIAEIYEHVERIMRRSRSQQEDKQ